MIFFFGGGGSPEVCAPLAGAGSPSASGCVDAGQQPPLGRTVKKREKVGDEFSVNAARLGGSRLTTQEWQFGPERTKMVSWTFCSATAGSEWPPNLPEKR